MNKTLKSVIMLMLVGIAMAACGQDESMAKSNQQRVLEPNVPETSLKALVDGNNRFALDLYRELSSGDDNVLFSPYSISLALAMTYGGARGETEAQMAEVLHFDLPQEALHAAVNQLDLDLASKSETDEEGNQPIQLDIANAIWAQQDYDFLQEYLDLLALNYGAGLHLADFTTRTEQTTQEINLWVSDQTHERIPNALEPTDLSPLTRMVLVNAIYFKADWADSFAVEDSRPAPFTLMDETEIIVKMMENKIIAPYRNGVTTYGVGYQVVRLLYVDQTMAMEIIVPDQGQLEAFEAALDWQTLDDLLLGIQYTELLLKMPKFSFTRSLKLAHVLGEMGMIDAFDPNLADFSGVDGTRDIYIDKVIHQAFVAVDEKGSEAAAVTIVVDATKEAPPSDILEFTIDRPFIFLIRDLSSGQILFLGRVLNPLQ